MQIIFDQQASEPTLPFLGDENIPQGIATTIHPSPAIRLLSFARCFNRLILVEIGSTLSQLARANRHVQMCQIMQNVLKKQSWITRIDQYAKTTTSGNLSRHKPRVSQMPTITKHTPCQDPQSLICLSSREAVTAPTSAE